MSGPLRALLIGRHYWPHASVDSTGYLYQLAVGLHRRGIHVEVVSPRYAASWPDELVIREIKVHRPTVAPRSDWSMSRYVRHLTQWLRERARSYDVLLADSIRDEAAAVIEATRAMPCGAVLRYSGWGRHDDWAWWQRSRAARRCAAVGKSADAVVCKCPSSHRALLSEGYRPAQIHRIDLGYLPGSSRSGFKRNAARRTLAAVNRDLDTDDGSVVVVCFGRMTRDSGINRLAASARLLVRRYPNLKLWFLGDGPHRDSIHELITGDGVRRSVAMPGSFCDWEDIYAAADIYVQADEDGLESFFPAAISAELPVVTLDNEATRGLVMGPNSQHEASLRAASLVDWFVPDSAKSLRMSLRQAIDNLDQRRRHAAELRRHLIRTSPQSDAIERYVHLMEQIRNQQRGDRGQNRTGNQPRPVAGDSSLEAAT